MNGKVKISIIAIAAAALVLAAAAIAGGLFLSARDKGNLPADGYVLSVGQEEGEASVYARNFAADTLLTKKFPASYAYRDVEGDKTVVDEESFLHYADGSLSALTDGVVVDASAVNDSVVEFYSLEAHMVMSASGEGWTIDNNAETLEFPELLWMLNEKKFLAASSELTVNLSNGETHTVNGYLEITYLDEGIVQLANAENLWQNLASNTTITFASGAVLDLGEGVLYNEQQVACVTLTEMAADINSAIKVSSESADNWVPPTFKVTAESGQDGEDGQDGEEGEEGEEGKEGEEGEEGKEGETGATGGTPGASSPGTDESAKSSTMGTIRVSSMQYTASAVAFYLEVLDDDSTLTANTGELEIRRADTNQLVWSYASAYGTETLDLTSVNSATPFIAQSGLNPDTEYILIVKNGYSMQTLAGSTQGTKTFVSRHFFTSTEGVMMADVTNRKCTATSGGGLEILLEKQSYSTANSAMVRLQIGDHFYDQEIALDQSTVELLFDFDDTELLSVFEAESASALSNMSYTLTLYSSESAAHSGAYDMNAEGEFQGDVQQSAYQLSGKTLKKEPLFGSLEVTNSNQGYYTLEQKILEDKDGSITKYSFVIERQDEATGEMIQETLESTTGIVSWYYQDPGTYTIHSVVTWDDNEKLAEKEVGSQTISLTVEGSPVLTFEPYTLRKDGNRWYAQNSSGELIDDVYGYTVSHPDNGFTEKELFDASRAWGDLVINTNGAVLDETKSLSITVTSDQSTYRNTFQRTVTSDVKKDGEIRFPLQLVGLSEGGIYTITVSGTVEKSVTIGGTEQKTTEEQVLGKCFFRTGSSDYPQEADNSVVVFQITANVTGEQVAIVKYPSENLYPDKYVEMNKNENYYPERATASAVEFTVYTNLGVKIGTFVKDLYGPCGYEPSEYLLDSTGEGKDYKKFLEGPLENGQWNENSQIIITKSDLTQAGLTTTDSGNIRIEATALYDYGYYLSNEEAGYVNHFEGGGVHYNRVPLKTVSVERDGIVTGEYLNREEVDLGKKAPVLPDADSADQEIEVIELENGGNTATAAGANIDKYGQETVIGYQLQSKFDNSSGDVNSVTYYVMKKEIYEEAQNESDPVRKYLDALENGKSEEEARQDSGILFAVELTNLSVGTLPSLQIFVSEEDSNAESAKWKDYWSKVEGDWKCTVKDNRVFVPSDWMPRGYNYVFAYTLKNFYGTSGLDEPWTYPYDIDQYNSTQLYTGKSLLPRSEGDDFLKETPAVAAYLESTRHEGDRLVSTWKYYVHDPDLALTQNEGQTAYSAIAGDQENYEAYAKNHITGSGEAVRLLTAEVGAYKTLAESGEGLSAEQLFGKANSAWKTEDIRVFTVEVSDGTGSNPVTLHGKGYSVWLEMEMFNGKYSEDSGNQTFQEWCGTTAAGYAYYFLNTVSQTVTLPNEEKITGEAEESGSLQYQLIPSGTTEVVTVNVTGDAAAINSLAALRYEIYKNQDNITIGELLQSGTVSCSNGTANIEMTNVEPETAVYIRVFPVYDTGYALTDALHASNYFGPDYEIHTPVNKQDDAGTKGYYFAPQTLTSGSPQYASQIILGSNVGGTQKHQLSFTSSTAANSVFEVKPGTLAAGEAGVTAHTLTRKVVPQSSGTVKLNNMQIGYGSGGAYNARENGSAPFAYKVLKEAPAVRLVEYDDPSELHNDVTTMNFGEDVYFSLNASRRVPTVVKRSINTLSPTSSTVSFTISEATYNMLGGESYKDGIYLRVWELKDGCEIDESTPFKDHDTNYEDVTAQGSTSGELRLFSSDRIQASGNNIGFAASVAQESEDSGLKHVKDEVSGDHTYTVTFRNLMPGKKYYYGLYCKNHEGTEQPFIDGSNITSSSYNDNYYDENGHLIQNPDLMLNLTQPSVVQMGLIGIAGAVDLKAAYNVQTYNQDQLEVQFTTNYRQDLLFEYEIQNMDGEPIVPSADLMKLEERKGYEQSGGLIDYWDYENDTWQKAQDTTYYTETGEPFSLSYVNTLLFSWGADEEIMKNLTDGQSYRLVLKVRYSNPLLKYTPEHTGSVTPNDNYIVIRKPGASGTTEYLYLEEDTAEFNVPAKADPTMVQTKASITDVGTEGERELQATVNMYVSDLSYRLGYYRDEEGLIYGRYGIRIYYRDGVEEIEVNPAQVTVDGNPAVTEDGRIYLEANKRQTLLFPVEDAKQYFIEVYGLNLNKPSDKNEPLLNSRDVASLHQSLNVANVDAPRAEDSKVDLETDLGALTVTLYNGRNLEKLNTARLTMTVYHTEADGTVTENVYSKTSVITFQPASDVGGRTRHIVQIDLSEELRDYVKQNDALSISIYFYQDATLYLDNIATYNLDKYDKPE